MPPPVPDDRIACRSLTEALSPCPGQRLMYSVISCLVADVVARLCFETGSFGSYQPQKRTDGIFGEEINRATSIALLYI